MWPIILHFPSRSIILQKITVLFEVIISYAVGNGGDSLVMFSVVSEKQGLDVARGAVSTGQEQGSL